ncbi:MAG: hypothetical protein ACOYNF_08685 [Rhodoferax sp.]
MQVIKLKLSANHCDDMLVPERSTKSCPLSYTVGATKGHWNMTVGGHGQDEQQPLEIRTINLGMHIGVPH